MAEGNAISVKIGAETDGIEQGLRSIQSSLGRLENSSKQSGDIFDASFGKIAGATAVGQLAVKAFTGLVDAAFAGVRNTIQGFTAALDLGGTLSDLSAATGESAGNLLLLQRAFDNTGAGADKVGPALAKLQNNIFGAGEGSKEAAAAFGRMGISLAELAGKTPTEQLALVASGITSIEDPAARAATAIDIFGKSGAELLPLLTNFSGEMTEASATVGSLAEIMDRRANVFDAVSDRFKIISEKVRDFAAGILDRALPAIDAITTALSRIDAAAIGQRLADAFLGGQDAMKGFQAAVDAISIGQVRLAFSALWESLKLQAMQTADAIYKNLVAGFQTAGDFIQRIFDPSGTVMAYINGAFEILGLKAAATLASSLASALPDDFIFGGLKQGMSDFAKTAKEDSDMLWGAMVHDVDYLKAQLIGAGASLPDSFAKNYSKIPPLFDGITAQQNKVAELEAQVTAATAATTAEREKQTAQTEAELAARQALKDAASAADAAAKADKLELITLETSLNEAKAAGNTELAASLEKQLQQKKAGEEIAKLTEEYVKTLGVTKEEAGVLATNFVNAKNAAAGLSTNTKTFASWLDYIEGTQPEEPVKKMSEKAADARKEIEAFGKYIGTDLSGMSFPDIAKKLGVDTLGMDGSQQIDAILSHLDSERQKLEGIVPVDESGSKTKIDELGTHLEKNFKKSVDLALNGSDGSKILSEVKTLVSGIKDLVAKIEPKLPQQALA